MKPYRKPLFLLSFCALLAVAVAAVVYFFPSGPQPFTRTSEDGTEVNGTDWHEEGLRSSANCMGRDHGESCGAGFRFHLEDLNPGDRICYARLGFPSTGGRITSAARLIIEGVLQESPTAFSDDDRPSQKGPKTRSRVEWEITEPWEPGTPEYPHYYSSPEISPVINEILALPGWGRGPEGKALLIIVRDASDPEETNHVTFSDYSAGKGDMKSAARLEVFKTLYDAFLGKELLGRVTDSSVAIKLYALVDTDLYVEYGTSPGNLADRTRPLLNQPGQRAVEVALENLEPNTRYHYRLMYRRAGAEAYTAGPERTFHTQRPRGSAFTFAIQSDEHILNAYKLPSRDWNKQLYRLTLENMAGCAPDFFISIGDFSNTELYVGRSAYTYEEAVDRYLLQREYIDGVGHSIPFYLVIGNHEGENGWYYHSGDERLKNLAVFSTRARKELIANPVPNGFYTGNEDRVPEYGLREDYYAWEWGDALFVCLDPFWYTPGKPHEGGAHNLPITYDGWTWTLGREQYDWLYETLHGSGATWKFVFIHHLVSTATETYTQMAPYYGRGGIEVAKHKVEGNPSFEWGGEDGEGRQIFEQKRPGWTHGPIHDMFISENVDIVFHGHDHLYAMQELDGIVYQECPQPLNALDYGYRTVARYKHGKILPSAGHLRVTVSPETVEVAYVRTFLPKQGQNGKVGYTYTLSASD